MFRHLDELLRGERTSAEKLAAGRLPLSLRVLVPAAAVLAAIYGFFMGWFAAFGDGSGNWMQLLASAVKLPALFLLTLLVTFPSLYVFNALLGSRLTFADMLRLLVAAVVVNATVAASLGPILGFFTFSTNSYSFMVFLNVALLALAGAIGLTFLLSTLRRLAAVQGAPAWQADLEEARRHRASAAALPAESKRTGGDASMGTSMGASTESTAEAVELAMSAPRRLPDGGEMAANSIFRVWVLIYALVGAQMGWLLRPFIGDPDLPFTWFRARQSNVFESLYRHLAAMMGAN